MKKIGEIIKNRSKNENPNVKKKPPHDLAGIVDLIEKEIGLTKKYNYKYWLGKIKQSGIPLEKVYLLIEEAIKLDNKYSKGGWLTNQLSDNDKYISKRGKNIK